jgi:Colicin V production protein
VNALDIGFLLAAGAAAVGGWRQGIVVRIATSCGSVGGVLLAAANVDWIAKRLPGVKNAPKILAVLAALVIGWVGGRLLGGFIGRWFRGRIPTKTLQKTDRLAGFAAGVFSVALTLWLATPVLKLLPGWPSRVSSESVAIRRMTDAVGLAPLPIDPTLWKVPSRILPTVPETGT